MRRRPISESVINAVSRRRLKLTLSRPVPQYREQVDDLVMRGILVQGDGAGPTHDHFVSGCTTNGNALHCITLQRCDILRNDLCEVQMDVFIA